MPIRRLSRFSVRARITLLALGLALTPLILVSALGLSALARARDMAVQAASEALRDQAENDLARWAADKARLYDAKLAQVYQQVETVADYAMAMPVADTFLSDDPVWISPDGPTANARRAHAGAVARAQRYIPLLRASVAQNDLVSLGYVALEEGGVIAFDRDINPVLDAIKPFDARTRSWYIAARNAGTTVWVDTYVDANTKQLTTTCAAPLYDRNGAFVGVVGFDVLLETIQQDILSIDIAPGGSAFLVNERGDVLARNDMQAGGRRWDQPLVAENLLQDTDEELRSVAGRMVRAEQGVVRMTLQGDEVYLAFAPITSAGWAVGIVIPEATVTGPAQQIGSAIALRQDVLSGQIALVIGLSLIAVLVLGMPLALLLTRPLRELQVATRRVAAGEFDYRVPDSGDHEIGDVGRSFNTMTDALREKISELELNLRQLAALNEVSNRFRAITSVREQIDAIPRGACECLGFARAVLYLIEGDELRATSAWFGQHEAHRAAELLAVVAALPIRLDSATVAADVVRSGQAVIVDGTPMPPVPPPASVYPAAYVQVPLFGREERVIGLLSADFNDPYRIPTARDAAQLMAYAGMAGLTIENTWLYADLERQVAQRTDELRAALARAQEADRLKGQFLAAVSHELRTPLNAIIGFSTVMLDEIDGPVTPLQREDLKIINRNGRFLLHLINELLDLARIEAGKIDLDRDVIDVRALVVEVAETVQGLLHNRSVALKIALPDRLPHAYADAAKIRQVLLNLLANAVKFTEEGAITIGARCVVMPGEDSGATDAAAGAFVVRNGRRLNPYIAISVRDTGVGIAPEDLPLVFEAFQQVRPGVASRGSGLGLAISRRLIEAHGGRIWVESAPGQGSLFTFTIPCAVEAREQRPAAGDHQVMNLAGPAVAGVAGARPASHAGEAEVQALN